LESGWKQNTSASVCILASKINSALHSLSCSSANGVTDPGLTPRTDHRSSSGENRKIPDGSEKILLKCFISIFVSSSATISHIGPLPRLSLKNKFLQSFPYRIN